MDPNRTGTYVPVRSGQTGARSIRDEMRPGDSESSSRLPQSESGGQDQPAEDLIAEGGTEIVWDDRWHEEEIFANRLSFYILAQSFLVAAAVTATLSSDAASRWLPVALTIDLAGLLSQMVALVVARPWDTNPPRGHVDRAYRGGDRHGVASARLLA